MNIIDIIFIAILGISLISGMQKGFLASLLATFGFVGAWLIARSACMTLSQQFMVSDFYNNFLKSVFPFTNSLSDLENMLGSKMGTLGSQMSIICEQLAENNVHESVINSFMNNAAAFGDMTLADYFTRTVWQAAFNVISFAIVFAIAYAVIMLVVNLLNNVFRTPKLRGVDALLGGLLGLVRGYAVVCLICAILPMVYTAIDSKEIFDVLESSSVCNFFLTSESVFKDFFKIGDQLEKIVMLLPNI